MFKFRAVFERMMDLKATKALVALLLCVLLAGCSLVKVNNDRVIVATIGDQKITLTQYLEYADFLMKGNGIDTSVLTKEEKETVTGQVLDAMVSLAVQEQKLAQMGMPFSQADEEQATAEIEEMIESQYQQLLAFYQQDETVEDPEAKALEMSESYFIQQGFDKDIQIKARTETIRKVRLREEMTKDITVTDEEVQTYYDNLIAQKKEAYTKNLAQYATDASSGEVYYTPAGYFYVKHILLALDEETQQQLQTLRYTDGDNEAADKLREEKLAAIQSEAEAVLAKVQAGEDFDALIDEYGDDPGMKDEETKKTGYLAYSGATTMFVDEFQKAVDTLSKDGDTSGLVASDYGYHIIRRVSTLEENTVPLAEVEETIREEALTDKKTTQYNEMLTQWIEEANVKLYPNRVQY